MLKTGRAEGRKRLYNGLFNCFRKSNSSTPFAASAIKVASHNSSKLVGKLVTNWLDCRSVGTMVGRLAVQWMAVMVVWYFVRMAAGALSGTYVKSNYM